MTPVAHLLAKPFHSACNKARILVRMLKTKKASRVLDAEEINVGHNSDTTGTMGRVMGNYATLYRALRQFQVVVTPDALITLAETVPVRGKAGRKQQFTELLRLLSYSPSIYAWALV